MTGATCRALSEIIAVFLATGLCAGPVATASDQPLPKGCLQVDNGRTSKVATAPALAALGDVFVDFQR